MKIVVDKPYKAVDIKNTLDLLHKKGTTIYKGRNTLKSIGFKNEKWTVKAFKIPHIINKIAYRYFRKSKARRSFEYAKRLLDKGVLTPKPIAYAEQKTAFFLLQSYYVSENLNYDITFRELISDINYPDRTKILQDFTAFTYDLHVNGIHFIDHSPGNTLIVKTKKGKYQFYLVDLNRMKFGYLNYKTRIQNFAKLSLTDEMVKIIAYEYASLSNIDFEEVYAEMLNVCHAAASKRAKKAALKKKVGL
ncbi:MAG: lipopolysaccharide kinase InaA family protein [Flavobacteriaceae bacterium]|nr:lipopolysaccharide kinase InaA family protein [Flavobacteriaceae bacterium]